MLPANQIQEVVMIMCRSMVTAPRPNLLMVHRPEFKVWAETCQNAIACGRVARTIMEHLHDRDPCMGQNKCVPSDIDGLRFDTLNMSNLGCSSASDFSGKKENFLQIECSECRDGKSSGMSNALYCEKRHKSC